MQGKEPRSVLGGFASAARAFLVAGPGSRSSNLRRLLRFIPSETEAQIVQRMISELHRDGISMQENTTSDGDATRDLMISSEATIRFLYDQLIANCEPLIMFSETDQQCADEFREKQKTPIRPDLPGRSEAFRADVSDVGPNDKFGRVSRRRRRAGLTFQCRFSFLAYMKGFFARWQSGALHRRLATT